MNDPFNSDPFRQAMGEQVTRPWHRVGGHAYPIQDAVEVDAAQVLLGGRVDYTDPNLYEEAGRWTLLAQIDSDDGAEMCWGRCRHPLLADPSRRPTRPEVRPPSLYLAVRLKAEAAGP